jgi:hypothetical protein
MHEPPTKRSWYISVATSTLRALILIAAIAIGIVVIKSAFPENASQTITTVPPGGKTTTTTTTPGATSPSPSAKPRIKGVVVQVKNGTSTTGLAAIVTGQLKKAGYSVKTPGDAATATRTTIYYQEGFKAEADYLKRKRFKKAVVAPAPSSASFPATIDIIVVLGADFTVSPSP